MTFIPTQPPDDSSGARYSKGFKYVFAMLGPGDDLSQVDPSDSGPTPSSLVTDNRFVSLVLPQQLTLSEPFATVITVMQDGGKTVESRGQVIKMGTISGTTGFLPPGHVSIVQPQHGQLIPNVANLDQQLGYLSGYLAFMKLRYLFRMYGDERRKGNLDVQMHFFDYKNDDFWRIEPESFVMTRSSRRPMSYDYNIPFKCLEYSNAVIAVSYSSDIDPISLLPSAVGGEPPLSGALAKVAGGFGVWKKPSFNVTTSRLSSMVSSALAFINHCDAVVQRTFQTVLGKINAVVGVLQAANDAFFTQLDLAISILVDASAELDFLSVTADRLSPDNINQEINEWYLEARTLVDHLGVQLGITVGARPQQDVQDTNQRFSQGRGKQGSTTDLMQPVAGSLGSPDANPFIGTSGLGLVTDVAALASNTQYTTIIINVGEDIYGLARRLLGDINRFMDLVLVNRLEFPFIVADPNQKPPNTLAWGDSVLVPVTSSNATGTSIAGSSDSDMVPTTSGTVSTPSLPSQLIDVDAAWLTDQWIGYTVTATTGGFTQPLIVLSNTATQLTLNGNFTITITPGTTTYAITYNLFNPRRPLTADARAFGTDFLVVYDSDGHADLAIGARGDLARVSGLDNFIQAITLRARCPIGFHPFHPSYGLPAPVGRPATDSVFVLNSFFTRRSLLSDPRVGKVRNVQYSLVGDTTTLNAEVQPVDSRLSRPISIQVGT